jgi:hypothetical protein
MPFSGTPGEGILNNGIIQGPFPSAGIDQIRFLGYTLSPFFMAGHP